MQKLSGHLNFDEYPTCGNSFLTMRLQSILFTTSAVIVEFDSDFEGECLWFDKSLQELLRNLSNIKFILDFIISLAKFDTSRLMYVQPEKWCQIDYQLYVVPNIWHILIGKYQRQHSWWHLPNMNAICPGNTFVTAPDKLWWLCIT